MNDKEKIKEMIDKIRNEEILRLIYFFVKAGYRKEVAGNE